MLSRRGQEENQMYKGPLVRRINDSRNFALPNSETVQYLNKDT
jgi:hypothetical protein